ncbi:MAG: hypothetical protein JXQ76_13155 [Campylobacterales bacterium]|nr:hypothetical protein [Campylobacterales bacterium]
MTRMNHKSRFLIKFFVGLVGVGIVEIVSIVQTQSIQVHEIEQKQNFVLLSGLPDLAIATEAGFVRHRTLSTVFDIYRDGEGLLGYFPSSFIYWHSNIAHQTPSKVVQ